MIDIIEVTKAEEGFRGTVYIDTEGFPTIGYGTKLPITTEEGQLLLEFRIRKVQQSIDDRASFKEYMKENEKWKLALYKVLIGKAFVIIVGLIGVIYTNISG